MRKAEMAILERAYDAEIRGALEGGLGIMQRRINKTLAGLVADGYLEARQVTLGGQFPVLISGYGLAHLGRLAYCTACTEFADDGNA